jgi:hypothetical protein
MALGFWVDLHLIFFVGLVFEDGLETFQEQLENKQHFFIIDADQCDNLAAKAFIILCVLGYELVTACLVVLFIMLFDLKDRGCLLWHRNSAGLLI